MWELRPTMGAAWELHLAAAFGRPRAALKTRPGAATRSCAGQPLNFSMGAADSVGAVSQPLPAAAKHMGAAFNTVGAAAAAKFDLKSQIFYKFS